jgi:hypothetical protein
MGEAVNAEYTRHIELARGAIKHVQEGFNFALAKMRHNHVIHIPEVHALAHCNDVRHQAQPTFEASCVEPMCHRVLEAGGRTADV